MPVRKRKRGLRLTPAFKIAAKAFLGSARIIATVYPDKVQAALERPEAGALVRGKWLMDEAKSLTEAASMLEEHARYLRRLADQGYELEGRIEDDMGVLIYTRKKRTKKARRS